MEKFSPENNEEFVSKTEESPIAIGSGENNSINADDRLERFGTNDEERLKEVREKLSEIHEERNSGTIELKVGKKTITVEWRRFLPETTGEEKITNPKNNVIFFNGWSMNVDAKSPENLADNLAEEVTKNGYSAVYSIDTRAEQIVDNSIMAEAEAVRRLIEEQGLKEVILAGHSQGGLEAATLAAILKKKNPEIELDGVILLDPVGIYDQGSLELAYNFMENSLSSFFKSPLKKVIQEGLDIAIGLGREIKKSGFSYPKRFGKEVSQMAKQSPLLKKIKCPVVLIQGMNDSVSMPEKTEKAAIKGLSEDEITEYHEKNLAKIFPNSSYIKWARGKEFGNHDMPLIRSEQIATVVAYLLRRAEREKQSTQNNE